MIVLHIIKNEVRGRYLGISEKRISKPIEDASTCNHPDEDMIRGGCAPRAGQTQGKNVAYQWFTCRRCHGRWERTPLLVNQSEETTDDDPLDFGKFTGRAYSDVFNSQKAYCDWVVDTSTTGDSPSRQLQRFARYILAKRESQILARTQPDYEEEQYPVEWSQVDEPMGQESEIDDQL